MAVLDRDALEQSPLADLHAIASELSLDGYRRLRKAELIDAIIERQGGAPAPSTERGGAGGDRAAAGVVAAGGPRTPRRRRADGAVAPEVETAEETPAEKPARRRRGAKPPRRPRRPAPADETPAAEPEEARGERSAEGVVEVLPNGSGFLRVSAA